LSMLTCRSACGRFSEDYSHPVIGSRPAGRKRERGEGFAQSHGCLVTVSGELDPRSATGDHHSSWK
jgi:hypothetical protein